MSAPYRKSNRSLLCGLAMPATRAATLAALLFLGACADTTGPAEPLDPPIASVELRPAEEQTVEVGATLELHAVPRTAAGDAVPGVEVAWSSSDTTVAAVSTAGRVTALGAGTAAITARAADRSASVRVRVLAAAGPSVTALEPSSALAGRAALAITIRGAGFVAGSKVYWDDSELMATVVGPGEIRATVPAHRLSEAGQALVRVVNEGPGGGTSESATFTVSRVPVASVVVTAGDAYLVPVGGALGLTALTFAADGSAITGRAVTWLSGAEDVARVDAGGMVTGIAPGVVTIRAIVEGREGSLQLRVVEPTPGQPVLAGMTPDESLAGAAVEITLRGSGFAPNAGGFWNSTSRYTEYVSDTELRMSLSAEDVARSGTGRIRVHHPADDGGTWSNELVFTVTPALTQITITPPSVVLWPGESRPVAATTLDEQGRVMEGVAMLWESRDPAVATVDPSGRITAVGIGETIIRAGASGTYGGVHVRVAAAPTASLLFDAGGLSRRELWVYNAAAQGVRLMAGRDAVEPAVTRDGTRIAFAGTGSDGNVDIYVVRRDGTDLQRLTDHAAVDDQPAWSPDGTRIAFRSRRDGGHSDVWVMNADGGSPRNVTSGGIRVGIPHAEHPTWTPDGSRVAVSYGQADTTPRRARIVLADPDGYGGLEGVTTGAWVDTEPAYSPDGSRLAVTRIEDGQPPRVVLLSVDGQPAPGYGSIGDGRSPAWSADGAWLALVAPDAGGADGVHVANLAEGFRRPLLSRALNPVWLP